jgi:hypothetical protein
MILSTVPMETPACSATCRIVIADFVVFMSDMRYGKRCKWVRLEMTQNNI